MPSGPVANWNRHQSKKAATPVDAIAASAGSRGNVGKLCPAGHGESDQSTGTGNRILRFPILISHPVGRAVQAAVCKTAEAGAIPARDSSVSASLTSAATSEVEYQFQFLRMRSRASAQAGFISQPGPGRHRGCDHHVRPNSNAGHREHRDHKVKACFDWQMDTGSSLPFPLSHFLSSLRSLRPTILEVLQQRIARSSSRARPLKPRGQGASPWRCTISEGGLAD